HIDPVLRGTLQATDAVTHGVVENLRSAAGNGIEPGVTQARDGIADGESADLGDVSDLGRRKTVAVDLEALFDGAQQVFVPVDFEIGVQAALHQDASAAQADGLLNFVEDDIFGEDVAFGVT